ncbi:MAG TPA: hypothetical protein VEQ63_05535, partial [Bryobacteraceae bacterium]|nr:hypothetical protein [Bryobacteraceae bacterium]
SVPVSLIDMFRYPTVSALAAFVQQKSAPAQTEAAPVANRSQSRLDSLSRRQALRQRHAVAGDTAHQS